MTCIILNVHETAYMFGWFKEKIKKMNKTDLGSVWQTVYIVNDRNKLKLSTKNVRQESKCSGLGDRTALTWGTEA
jgi:hypothetical protein